MVDPQLVSDSLVFSRKKTENAKMAAVVVDVFWHFVEGLREIDNAAVSVPPVDEIVDYFGSGCFHRPDHQRRQLDRKSVV